MFPLKAPFSSGISQPSMFDDTGSNGTEMPRYFGGRKYKDQPGQKYLKEERWLDNVGHGVSAGCRTSLLSAFVQVAP